MATPPKPYWMPRLEKMDRELLRGMSQEERLRFFLSVLEEINRRRWQIKLARRKEGGTVICPYCKIETEAESRWHERCCPGPAITPDDLARATEPIRFPGQRQLRCKKCDWNGLAADVVTARCPVCSQGVHPCPPS